jgi:hypothetical protein
MAPTVGGLAILGVRCRLLYFLDKSSSPGPRGHRPGRVIAQVPAVRFQIVRLHLLGRAVPADNRDNTERPGQDSNLRPLD